MKVNLKSSSGSKTVSIQEAQNILNYKKILPSQDWELDDVNFKYEDGQITRVKKKVEKE